MRQGVAPPLAASRNRPRSRTAARAASAMTLAARRATESASGRISSVTTSPSIGPRGSSRSAVDHRGSRPPSEPPQFPSMVPARPTLGRYWLLDDRDERRDGSSLPLTDRRGGSHGSNQRRRARLAWDPGALDVQREERCGSGLNPASRVWFTIGYGILNEIYYPDVDTACTRDVGLIVTDGHGFFSEEKRHARHEIRCPQAGVPAFRVISTCAQGGTGSRRRSSRILRDTRCCSGFDSRRSRARSTTTTSTSSRPRTSGTVGQGTLPGSAS